MVQKKQQKLSLEKNRKLVSPAHGRDDASPNESRSGPTRI